MQEISAYYKLDPEDLELLELAAWFHDAGYVNGYENHEQNSCKLAQEYLNQKGFSEEKIKKIDSLIMATQKEAKPEGLLEEIIADADLLNIGKKNFFNAGKALRMEWELVCDKRYGNQEWEQIQFDFLVNTNFHTEYAIKNYGDRRKKNIAKQRQALAQGIPAQGGKPGRGIETMYRATYRNHINLSSIADNKANMMISINTIIMSIIITILGSGFTFTGTQLFKHLRFTIPISFLLVACLVSAIFAILSARPNITKHKVELENIKKNKTSILFFGNFVKLSLPKFIKGMRTLKANNEFLYDNMTVDLYYLGMVLTKKYKLLRISYNIFMIGVVVGVIVFLIMFFLSYEKL